MKKRGQGLSTTAIILIILGIVILVVLVIGFSIGWGRVSPFISKSNVDSISTQCSVACTTNSVYDFCSKARNLNDGNVTLKGITCYYLASEKSNYGIAKCPAISCDVSFVNAKSVADLQTPEKCTGHEGKTIQALINNELQSYSCPAKQA